MTEKNPPYQPIYYLYFTLAAFAVFFYYHIDTILHFPAQGAHIWRQSDSLAMVWNYKLFHVSFWRPEIFNLISDNGKGVAEFPIFYYLAAQFQQPELALRTIHFSFLFFGLMDIFILAYYYLKNLFYALAVAGFIASSPLLIYYGTSFIIDVPAFFFAMMAWSVFFTKSHLKYGILFSLVLFSFASLLKAVHLLNFIPLIFILFQEKQLSKKRIAQLLIVIAVPLSWYGYAKWFNAMHHNDYLFLSVQPIFQMSFYDIGLAAWRIIVSWSSIYFWRPTSILLIIFLIYVLKKKSCNKLYQMIFLTFLMSLLYLCLFLEKLILHEYYYAFFYINVVFVVIGLMFFLRNLRYQPMIRVALILFLTINIMYCKSNVYRLQDVQKIDSRLRSEAFQAFLNKNNCTLYKTVFCYDDNSVDQILCAIKRKGITQYDKNWMALLKKKQIDFILIRSKNYSQIASQIQPKSIATFSDYLLIELSQPQ